MHPTTIPEIYQSVLSGLSPSIILEICSRCAMINSIIASQLMHLDQCSVILAIPNTSRKVASSLTTSRTIVLIMHSSFQQAVVRNMNEKNAQMQKQLENVIREGEQNKIALLLI